MRYAILLIVILPILLAACAKEGDPSKTVESYLQARVESNADKLRSLSCAAWEEQAMLQADSFKSMDAHIEGMSCKADGKDGDFTRVTCQGKIVTTYNGETREWALGSYHLKEEDGEWKMCGEASPN
jgi:hypothetical protein